MTDLSQRIREFAESEPNAKRVDRFHPVVRLLAPAVALIGVLVSGSVWVYYGFAALILVIAITLGVGRNYWSRFWKIGLTVGLFTLVIRGFFHYGSHVVLTVGPFTVTVEGLESANWYTAMLLAVCAPIILISCVLSVADLTRALESLGASREMSYVVMNSVRMIPELGVTARAVQDAQRSRGIQVDGGRIARLKALVPTVGPLVLSAINGVEERAVAMEVRGFGVSKTVTSLKVQRGANGREIGFIVLVSVLSLALGLAVRFL